MHILFYRDDLLLDLNKAKRKYWFRTEFIPSSANKAANARGFQALCAQGKVYIPFTDWGDELIDQLVKFIPDSNFKDDKVDVCGLFGRILDQTYSPGVLSKPDEEEISDPYGETTDKADNWKTT